MNEYKEVGSEGHISGLEVYTPTPIAGRSYGTPRSHPEDHQVDLTNSTISEGQLPTYVVENGHAYQLQTDMHTERTPARRNKEVPYGLSPIAFAALVALATAIIVGAAIGGGLGGSLSHLQSENKYVAGLRAGSSCLGTNRPLTIHDALGLSSSLHPLPLYQPARPHHKIQLPNRPSRQQQHLLPQPRRPRSQTTT